MGTFLGECNGGPWDKQRLAHTSRTKKLYRPLVAMTMDIESAPVEPVEIGAYELDDFGRWNWHATKSGRAFNQLFGKP